MGLIDTIKRREVVKERINDQKQVQGQQKKESSWLDEKAMRIKKELEQWSNVRGLNGARTRDALLELHAKDILMQENLQRISEKLDVVLETINRAGVMRVPDIRMKETDFERNYCVISVRNDKGEFIDYSVHNDDILKLAKELEMHLNAFEAKTISRR